MEQPNLNYIDQLAGDDAPFRQKLIDTIKSELPTEIDTYKSYLSADNYNATAGSVHKLKHKISVMGMEKSYYIAEEFEKNLKNNSLDLQADFEAILASMQNYIDGIQ
ncbi:histidine kinase [Flavobacterium beibuense F44-8]|uniref:Histidine kinase n=1 Tax=Flavobacterium beibuense F44-8 TaxID=1406840 RepID=A0A0A2LIY7_9FLAO|nr:Hpt domain-containing protein [Flavobacterium beibuense]KGO79176.1 histidine kinase [Flavobacterium beibuense F44-8]